MREPNCKKVVEDVTATNGGGFSNCLDELNFSFQPAEPARDALAAATGW
jgi:hypothetical protein